MPTTIFALDLATRTGFAVGTAGSMPRSGAMILKAKGDDQSVAFGNLIAWLNSEWSKERPDLVVFEAPLHLGGFQMTGNSEASVMNAYGMRAVTMGLCNRFGLPFEKVYAQTVRKHFLGRANAGNRKDTKAAVVLRAQLLGYIPRICMDEDRSDACAIWDYAAAKFGKTPTNKFYMFGERAA